MECKKKSNLERCTCSYTSCPRKGICCECISHHIRKKELPGCCFPSEIEKTYDRSFRAFVEWAIKK